MRVGCIGGHQEPVGTDDDTPPASVDIKVVSRFGSEKDSGRTGVVSCPALTSTGEERDGWWTEERTD